MPTRKDTCKVNEELARELIFERSKIQYLTALKSFTDFQDLPSPCFNQLNNFFLKKYMIRHNISVPSSSVGQHHPNQADHNQVAHFFAVLRRAAPPCFR